MRHRLKPIFSSASDAHRPVRQPLLPPIYMRCRISQTSVTLSRQPSFRSSFSRSGAPVLLGSCAHVPLVYVRLPRRCVSRPAFDVFWSSSHCRLGRSAWLWPSFRTNCAHRLRTCRVYNVRTLLRAQPINVTGPLARAHTPISLCSFARLTYGLYSHAVSISLQRTREREAIVCTWAMLSGPVYASTSIYHLMWITVRLTHIWTVRVM